MNTRTHTVPSLAGYALLERLYKGSRTEVYRALQTERQQLVVIKVLCHQHPSFGELVQFRNQYAITRHLNHPAIVCPLALERCGNGYALVMPDEGFISLGTYSQQHGLDISTVLEIAIKLAKALHYLMSQRILHKDIKPANILIHPETQHIKLIDFSIASLLPKEQQQLINPNILQGTLAYISPEQTGRMNRGIDYRTDFYSLGVTLFELLTGELPFPTDDPMELVHSHIACPVVFPEVSQQNIPEMIQAIVLKLMSKNAEDRYQSALGLQHDLECCLHQWKATGEIIAFELGQRDISDRFLIPERLYGREAEVQTLLNAFDRVSIPPQSPLGKEGGSEMMLVAGFSGIGKTAVVNEVHKPITRQKGYFIQGKFDQFNRNVPFSAFVQAFRSLMGQLLSESDRQLQQWKSQILNVLGDQGQVIIEVIPELETIIGQQPPAPKLSGSAAQNRFNLLFGKFIQVFTTKDHPLVIFLDDLQWADSASLNLIKLLMSEASNSYLLMMGAYRDNEVFPTHPLMLTLDEMRKADATINTITLAPLSVANINCLVADTLSCDGEVAKPLTELLYQKTKGNPFFTTQFLLGLHGESLIQFDREVGHWECDIAQVRQRALTDDVVEFMAQQLQKLPEETQQVLKLAACIGNKFDLATLAIVSEKNQGDVATALWRSLQKGLVIPETEIYKFFHRENQGGKVADDISIDYRFLHDRVQQAAYALIPEAQKQVRHVQIGELLLANLSPEQQGDRIFEIVNHLNKGIKLHQSQTQRAELLQLNCIAGQRAKAATAYGSALNYFEVAEKLLLPNSWQQCYEQALEVYFNLAEVQYLSGDFQSSLALVETIANSAKRPIEQAQAFNLAVLQFTLQGKYLEALQYGQKALACLNFDLSETNLKKKIDSYQNDIDIKLAKRKAEQLINEPEATDVEQRMILNILSNLFVPTYVLQKDELNLVITLSVVSISLNFGMIAESECGFTFYGMFLGNQRGDYQSGYEFGVLATQIAKRFNQSNELCKACYVLGNNLLSWVRPLRDSEPIFREGLMAGLESGELIFSANILMYKPLNPFYAGDNILEIQQALPQDLEFASKTLNYQLAVDVMSGLSIWLADITGSADENLLTEPEYIEQCKANNSTYAICHYWILKTKVLCLYGCYEEALKAAQDAEDIISVIAGKYQIAALNFYQSIATIEYCRSHCLDSQNRYIQKVESNQAQLKKWAKGCPENFAHKYCLVDAVLNSLLGNKSQAIELFDSAVAGAKDNHFLQEEALANELAAKFYLDWGFDDAQPNGKEKIAQIYMQEAYYCYARWGAKAKTDHLEANYPQLLQPILQKTSQTLHPLVTLASISSLKSAVCSTTIETKSSETQINRALDLVTIFKASQAISSTIDLEELLTQLTQILLHNSGGDRCAIILCEPNRQVQVRAIAKVDATDLSSTPLKDASHLPVKLIQYVKNSGKTVVMDSPESDIPVVDRDLAQRQPASVLCLPLIDRTQLRGVLYLENQATSGVFHPQRLAALQLLATQAAIALENARLYQQAQDYAQQLEESQLQLVQSEKMSALGNLVAGVAHEINNPLGFINGNITEVRYSLNDITECLQSYRQTFPKPGEKIEALLEELEIDFLIEDLPKMLDSMKVGCDRIRGISTSLRMFSRADTESKFKANVHDGIDSTLLILKYRLKARDFRPEIEVIRDYGDLPEINCFPGQLNQVFMNLLANAIDMFDEIAEGLSSEQLQANPQRITIKTQVVEPNSIEVRIRDSGKGMSEEVCSKIFDRKFTTKGVGKGTGLGLAIARQVIVEKHRGSLEVQSKIGEGTEFLIRLPR